MQIALGRTAVARGDLDEARYYYLEALDLEHGSRTLPLAVATAAEAFAGLAVIGGESGRGPNWH